MRRALNCAVALLVVLGLATTAWAAEGTLDKISRTGVFTVGTRTASPPFGYINKQNEWVGFSIDLAQLVHKAIEKKLGKSIKTNGRSWETITPTSRTGWPCGRMIPTSGRS